MTTFASALDELAAAPLEDFVAARKRLAGEVRGAGDRSGAAQLLKVPKPSAAEWALAAVAREDPEAVAAWLEAATELREASSRPGEVGGDAVRAAMAAHRTATARLVGVVRERGGLTEAMTDRVRAALQAATADAGAAEALRAGRPPGFGGAGPAPAASPAGERRRTPPAGPDDVDARERERRDAEAAAERERRAEFERKLAEARAEVERLRDEASRTAAAAAAADEALEDARRTLHRRESEAAAAHDAAAEAAEAAAEARRAVDALRRRA